MRPQPHPADQPISDPFEPAPAGSYLAALEEESRRQARRRGDAPLPGRAEEAARPGSTDQPAPPHLQAAE